MKFFTSALLAILLLFSCITPVEEPNITYLDAGVNSETHLFNTFHVSQESETSNGETFDLVTVTASIENSPVRLMALTLREYELGFDSCYRFTYLFEGTAYERFDDSFVIEVVETNGYRIRGTFSGNLKSPETGEVVSVTNGGFDVFY